MSGLKLSSPGTADFLTEIAISQFVIPAGAGATITGTGTLATVTFNAAHGLTMTPAAGVAPNFFITFGGSTSALTGTGILVGNVFRILSIPSTTAIVIASTITGGTVTSMTGIPVFFVPFIAQAVSGFVNGPLMTAVNVAPALVTGGLVNCSLAANCVVSYCPDNTAIINEVGTGNTPATAPTYRTLIAASGTGQFQAFGPQTIVQASGTTATSRFSVYA